MRWVSLHHHSTFSFLDGYGLPEEHVKTVAELGMKAMALTEHGNLNSHPSLEIAAAQAHIKPLFGCELYANGKEKTQKKNHLTVIAESQEGYRNLMRLVSYGWNEGFYYEPTISGNALGRFGEGLIVLSGCRGSLLSTALVGGKNIEPDDASPRRGEEVARWFRERFDDRYYLEVQAFPDLPDNVRINQALEHIGRRLKIPLVATADVHYMKPDDNEVQKILHNIRPGESKSLEAQGRSWNYDVHLSPPATDKDVVVRLMKCGLSKRSALQALHSTEEIAERCNVTLPKAPPLKFPGIKDARAELIRELRDGWQFRHIADKPNRDEYAKRLSYEMSIVEQKEGYLDYFLIVGDMVRWAKDAGILVGPARGSAAASVICYLLRITEVDPIVFSDLVFERFIDVTRKDLPDIDLDFDDARRDEVFAYLRRRYGEDRVGQLASFTTFKSRISLDDIARVYHIPKEDVETVKGLLIHRSSGDLRADATIEDSIAMFQPVAEVFERHPDLKMAMRLEGQVKGMGTHAAGAIVSGSPLTDTTVIYKGRVSLDKWNAEYLNLLKIDVLGLSTCGLLSEAMRMLRRPVTDLYDLPLDDERVIEGFRSGNVVGIFQFDGRAARLVNQHLKPDNFLELAAVNALARPGPLLNNAMTEYVDTKFGRQKPVLVHPMYDAIVANTHHQIVYQEQVLRIVMEIGQFEWTHGAKIRKIISQKVGEQEFNRYWQRFLKGARANGLTREQARYIWTKCLTSGSYAFNVAHSVSYAMIAYWTMWLKVYHPLEFYVASLRRLPGKERDLLLDATKSGIRVVPPHPMSGVRWTKQGDNTIVAGLVQIPGIGLKMAADIVAFRKTLGRPMVWGDLMQVKGIGPKKMAAYKAFIGKPDPLEIQLFGKTRRHIIRLIKEGRLKKADGSPIPVPTHKSKDIPYGRGTNTEVTWIGTIINRNLRDLFEAHHARTGEVLDPKSVDDPELREWVVLHGFDGEEIVYLDINRYRFQEFKELIFGIKMEHDLVVAHGIKPGRSAHKVVKVDDLVVITP
jgi:DNA polymerase-3 subunit alpha